MSPRFFWKFINSALKIRSGKQCTMARDLSGFFPWFPQSFLIKNTQVWVHPSSCIPCYLENQWSANLDSCFLSKSLNNTVANFEHSCLLYHLSRIFTERSIISQRRFNVRIARTFVDILIPSTESVWNRDQNFISLHVPTSKDIKSP